MGIGYGTKMLHWINTKQIDVECKMCHKHFITSNNWTDVCPECRPERNKQYRKKYDESCKVEGTCYECGKTFRYKPTGGEEHYFCSAQCHQRFDRKNKGIYGKCITCGKDVQTGSYYCSDDCRWGKGRVLMNRKVITALFEAGVGNTVSDKEMVDAGFSIDEMREMREIECGSPPVSYYCAASGAEYMGSSAKFSHRGVPLLWESEKCREMMEK